MTGKVYLVGAGPGDPELITVRGHALLRQCDAIVYDRLIDSAVLPSPTIAEMHYVGKLDFSTESWTQEAINDLLVRLAREGKRVVRLKGGDPFVFGRGGEEAQVLADAGIPFEVVPGVSSGVAAPAYAGIPVTHRGISTSVTFVTANADPHRINAPIDWRTFGATPGTLVIFMGARTFPSIVPLLVEGGMPADRPAAAIQWGTYKDKQRTVVGTLGTLVDRMAEEGLSAPVSVVIGEVVRLRDQIAWFDGESKT